MPILTLIFIVAGLILLIAAVICAILAWRGESSLLMISDTPTSSVREVQLLHAQGRFGEPVEVIGTIECDTPLRAPYSETLCVAYEYAVNEEQERHTGRYRRRRREIELNSFDLSESRVSRCFVRDSSGRIAVDTAGAAIDMLETVARYESYTGLRGYEHEIWREEHAIPLSQRVYILGYLGSDQGEPVIMRHPLDPGRRFLISHRDEGALQAHTRRRSYLLYLAAGLSLGVAVLLFGLVLVG